MKRIVRIFGGAALIFVALVTTPFAYAASGWYLLIPPLGEYIEREQYSGKYKILDTKPLLQWRHHGSYDKASDCEGAKLSLRSGLYGISAQSSGDWSKAHDAKQGSEVLKKCG